MKWRCKMIARFFPGIFFSVFLFVGNAIPETKDLIPSNEVEIPLFKSYYVPTPPMPVKMVSVANPNIADVKIVTPKDILIEARGAGVTTVFLWFVEHDEDWLVIGRPICMKYNVKVMDEFEVETIKGTATCPAGSLREWQCEKSTEKIFKELPGDEGLIGWDGEMKEIIE